MPGADVVAVPNVDPEPNSPVLGASGGFMAPVVDGAVVAVVPNDPNPPAAGLPNNEEVVPPVVTVVVFDAAPPKENPEAAGALDVVVAAVVAGVGAGLAPKAVPPIGEGVAVEKARLNGFSAADVAAGAAAVVDAVPNVPNADVPEVPVAADPNPLNEKLDGAGAPVDAAGAALDAPTDPKPVPPEEPKADLPGAALPNEKPPDGAADAPPKENPDAAVVVAVVAAVVAGGFPSEGLVLIVAQDLPL